MYWANFLHFYQPAEQQPDVLESIVVQSYRPLIEGLKKHKRVRLTVNINGPLLALLDTYGYKDIIDALRILGAEEIGRQIKMDNETNSFFFRRILQTSRIFSSRNGV